MFFCPAFNRRVSKIDKNFTAKINTEEEKKEKSSEAKKR
jgi:hypothetical protein